MFNTDISNTFKNWWVILLAGILFLSAGIFVLINPLDGYVGLSIFFTISFLISGLSGLLFAFSNNHHLKGWIWYLISAIIDLIIGIVLYIHPLLSLETLPIFVGFVLLIRGSMGIKASLDLKHINISQWIWLLVLGILTILFSIFLLLDPFDGALTIVIWTGLGLITAGIGFIIFSFQIKNRINIILNQNTNQL